MRAAARVLPPLQSAPAPHAARFYPVPGSCHRHMSRSRRISWNIYLQICQLCQHMYENERVYLHLRTPRAPRPLCSQDQCSQIVFVCPASPSPFGRMALMFQLGRGSPIKNASLTTDEHHALSANCITLAGPSEQQAGVYGPRLARP